jgi:hypothetical protein
VKAHSAFVASEARLNQSGVAVLNCLSERKARVSAKPFGLKDNVLNGNPVHTNEPTSLVVERLPVLGFSSGMSNFTTVRMDSDVTGHFERRFFRMGGSSEFASNETGGEVNPSIGSKHRLVHAELSALCRVKTRDPNFALIGFSITVGVFQKQQVRRSGDEKSASKRKHAVGESEPGSIDGALIHHAVLICVFQENDVSKSASVARIAVVFGDIQAVRAIESERAGGAYQGFGCDEFDGEVRGGDEAVQGICR